MISFKSKIPLLLWMLGASMPGILSAHDMTPEAMVPAPGADSADGLAGLIAQALKNNPGIKAAELQVKALHSSPSHTWYLDAPQVGVEFYQAPINSFPNPIKNQMEIDYSIQQAFPFPGKIGSRIGAEHKHAEMGEADLAALKLKIAHDVKAAYYELYLTDRRQEINRESRGLIQRLIEIARRQYEVGMGRQADILKAQAEWTNLTADSLRLDQSRRSMAGMLNALLGRRFDTEIPIPDSLAPVSVDGDPGRFEKILDTRNPGLKGMKAGIAMREAEKAMARKEALPDFMVGGAYKDMLEMPEGTHGGKLQDYWSVMASMSVPLAFWSLPKYRAGVAESEVHIDQAREEYNDMRNMALAKAQSAWLRMQSAEERLTLSRELAIPQARQALESNQTAYQGGKSEFMTVLDAYRMELMAKENAEMALMEVLTGQADLEEALGVPLEAIPKIGSEGEGK